MPRTTNYTRAVVTKDTDFKSVAKKAIYSGAIGAAAGYFLLGETEGTLTIGSMAVPTAVGVGVGVAGGSVAGDLLSGYVIERMDQSDGMRTAESEFVKLGMAGVGTVATLKLAYGIDPSLNGALLGGGSKFAGDAVNDQMDDALLGMLF